VSIAIAVMARFPYAGDVKTRLAPRLSAAERALVYCAFLQDKLEQVRRAARETSVISPVVAFTPRAAEPWFRELAGPAVELYAQCDGSLGERVIAAFDALLDVCPEGVILVDSDSPDLPAKFLTDAAHALASGTPLVLGPAEDGGYYLIGLRQRAPALFDGVTWSTERTRAQTLEGAARLGITAQLLPTWYDVDTPDDLVRLEHALARDQGQAAPNTWSALTRLGRDAPR
jgi:uncharacterized protein